MAKGEGEKSGKKENNIIIKKVKKISGGAHGGAWKVAYADFVTAMMAFFLLMWLINSLKPETKASIATYFKEGSTLTQGGPPSPDIDLLPAAPEEIPLGLGDGEKEAMELQKDIEEIVETKLADLKDQILVKLVDGNVRIEIVDKDRNSLFSIGSSALNENAKKILAELSKAVIDVPNRVIIEGHTDSLNYSSSKYTNWELSTERATAAREVLERSGLASDRIAMVAGYASNIPLIKNNPASPENRRISIVVLSKNTKSIINLYK